jgi:phytoene dehydrogenase-like protein
MATNVDSYDAVVIWAGLGGLSAAAGLAKAGKRVLLAERQDGPGGNARAFARGQYTFDPAIHVTAQGFDVDFLGVYLEALGIASDLDLMMLTELYTVDVGGERFTLPTGIDAVIEYLGEQFPAEAGGIAAYIQTCAQVTRESQAPPPRVALKDLEAVMAALPMLFKYRTSTLQTAIEEFVGDQRARAVLGAQWPYMGLPPSELSFMAGTGVWMALMSPGPVYVRGSFQRLADALADVVEDNDGTLEYGTPVSRIAVEGGRATGVTLDGGREVRAPVIVSNADARLTFEQLVGAEHLPERFIRRLGRMRPSISAFMLYSACTLPLEEMELSAEVFAYEHWDHDQTWSDVNAGKLGGTWLSIPTLHDRSLAPEGEHLVIFTSLMPYDIGEPWAEAKARLTEDMTARVESLIPGYRESVTFLESATPQTFHDYTLAQDGAIYGWQNTPNQTLPKRLPQQSPIEGLLLAGHWTNPGTGSVRCLLSGLGAAAMAVGYQDPIEFLGTLAGD